jgi:hypothetical protein
VNRLGSGLFYPSNILRSAQKPLDAGYFIPLGLGVPLFPIEDAHLIAADDLSHIDLLEAKIEPSFANGFADCSWIGGIAFYLLKVWTNGATNPMKCCPTKRQRIHADAACAPV